MILRTCRPSVATLGWLLLGCGKFGRPPVVVIYGIGRVVSRCLTGSVFNWWKNSRAGWRCTPLYHLRNEARITRYVAAENIASHMPFTSVKTVCQRWRTSLLYLLCSAINIDVAIPAATVVVAMANYSIYWLQKWFGAPQRPPCRSTNRAFCSALYGHEIAAVVSVKLWEGKPITAAYSFNEILACYVSRHGFLAFRNIIPHSWLEDLHSPWTSRREHWCTSIETRTPGTWDWP